MSKPEPNSAFRTDEFRPDWAHTARSVTRVLYGLLAVIALCAVLSINADAFDQGFILSLAALLAVFGLAIEAFRRRASRNLALLVVGPEGVSFPANGIDPIKWTRVTRVRVVRIRGRGLTVTALRFRFEVGTLGRWQFGALGVDRWEVVTSVGSIFGKSSRVLGGLDKVIESIERFHPVER